MAAAGHLRADAVINQVLDQDRPDRPNRSVPYPRPRLSYLLKEMFGIHDLDDLYLYVTDGGHWENTGVVELLRDRSIDEVVCLDADEGPRERAGEIAAAIGLAKLECNVDIRLALDPLRGPGQGTRGSDYSQRSVNVGLILRGDQLGLLWYAKPVLAAATPLELLSYAECDPTFPATSTVNQFFHTAQFEAYRDLGRYNGHQIVTARRELAAATTQAPTFAEFQELAKLSTAHWSVTSLAALLDDTKYTQLRELLSRPSRFSTTQAAAQTTNTPIPTPAAMNPFPADRTPS